MSIRVLKPGAQTTVQAGPRSGQRHFGVPAGGAADPLSLALANRLVGNDLSAPAFEATFVGPRLRIECDTQIAITGAPATASVNDSPVELHKTIAATAGDELEVGAAELGCRIYIAIRGGLLAEQVLGSMSTYLPAALGGHEGRALQAGDALRLGTREGNALNLHTPVAFRPPITTSLALRACHSVETGLLPKDELDALFGTTWTVGRRADRMGLALEGKTLSVNSDGRMPSAAVFPGTLQCPEDGVPFLLSVDAQTTGGYPRVLQVTRADRHRLGQLRPGDRVQFLRREPDEAIAELRAMHDLLREWLPGVESAI